MQSLIERFSVEGLLVSPELLVPVGEWEDFYNFVLGWEGGDCFVVGQELYSCFKNETKSKTKKEVVETAEIEESSGQPIDKKPTQKEEKQPEIKGVELLKNFEDENEKIDISDFVAIFNSRFDQLKSILLKRPELRNAVSISTIISSNDDTLTTIGMVSRCKTTQKGNILINLEDPSGEIFVLIKKGSDLVSVAEELVCDEVVGVCGRRSGLFFFPSQILFPEIPDAGEGMKCPDEVYAVFTGDIHVGSNKFLEKEFSYFIKWLCGEVGTPEQKKVASKIKYLFIVGDIVDGVGVYPGQDQELLIKDVFDQYKKCAEFLSLVPDHIIKIIIPGNHDALRLAEPQHRLFEDFAAPLFKIKNVVMASNPTTVRIHKTENYPGLKVLLYHGYGFDFFVDTVPKLRNAGGYSRPDLIMQFLLRKRHLAPTFGSSLMVPMKKDFLVIDDVPDVFVSGHVHKAKIGKYKNVLTVCSSCWQARTPFQEKMGHHPEPGRVPVLNLKTMEMKMLKFV